MPISAYFCLLLLTFAYFCLLLLTFAYFCLLLLTCLFVFLPGVRLESEGTITRLRRARCLQRERLEELREYGPTYDSRYRQGCSHASCYHAHPPCVTGSLGGAWSSQTTRTHGSLGAASSDFCSVFHST